MPSTLEHALAYWDAGFNVIPALGKRPDVQSWKALQSNRADRAKVERYFTNNPTANIGFITGEVSGVTVLDLDVKSLPPEKVEQVKAAFLKEYKTPLVVATGGGGFHAYFRHEPGVKNAVGLPHSVYTMDLRTEGGFVVAPPSVHPDTKVAYRWHGVDDFDLSILGDIKDMLPPLPESVRNMLAYQRRGKLPEDWHNIVNGTKEGSRNYNCAAIFGKMLAAFPPQEWTEFVLPLVHAWNQAFVTPPMSDKELDSVFKSIAKMELRRRESPESKEVGKMWTYDNSAQPTQASPGVQPGG